MGSLADAAMSVYALVGLVRDYPNLKITVLTNRRLEPVFRGVVVVDFLFADDEQYRGAIGEVRLWRAVARLGVDGVADLSATLRSRFVTCLLPPWRVRRGRLKAEGLEGRALTRKYRKVMVQLTSPADLARRLFGSLGLPFCMPQPEPPMPVYILPSVVEILLGDKCGKWVGVDLLTHHNGTCYPIPLTARLIELLSHNYEKVVLFGAGEYQRQFAEAMQSKYERVVSVAGRVSVEEQMDILSVLDAVVCADGDILRLATLVGTPSISVWGATHYFLESANYGQSPQNVVQKSLPCRPCSSSGRRRCLFGGYACMNSITPEEIFERVWCVTATPDHQ
jgi:ADP-heptose:LPS heptosyltransferase